MGFDPSAQLLKVCRPSFHLADLGCVISQLLCVHLCSICIPSPTITIHLILSCGVFISMKGTICVPRTLHVLNLSTTLQLGSTYASSLNGQTKISVSLDALIRIKLLTALCPTLEADCSLVA